jgi:Zn-dependent M28 family amino/carboxypeptidase
VPYRYVSATRASSGYLHRAGRIIDPVSARSWPSNFAFHNVLADQVADHAAGGTLAGRVRPAAAAGAAAVIIYHDITTNVTAGSLGDPDPDEFVPAGFINLADGEAIKARLDAGETLEAHFQQTQVIEERITQNVVVETEGGDPDNVIVLGAHLDSVQAGPGINDDGRHACRR